MSLATLSRSCVHIAALRSRTLLQSDAVLASMGHCHGQVRHACHGSTETVGLANAETPGGRTLTQVACGRAAYRFTLAERPQLLAQAELHSSPQPSAAVPSAAVRLEDTSLPLPRFVTKGEKHRPPPSTLPHALHFVKV
jgi:hypothetical protein